MAKADTLSHEPFKYFGFVEQPEIRIYFDHVVSVDYDPGRYWDDVNGVPAPEYETIEYGWFSRWLRGKASEQRDKSKMPTLSGGVIDFTRRPQGIFKLSDGSTVSFTVGTKAKYDEQVAEFQKWKDSWDAWKKQRK